MGAPWPLCAFANKTRMKFFLDTANLDDIRKAAQWGIIDGVTTNPSLIAKEGVALEDQVRKIAGLVNGAHRADPGTARRHGSHSRVVYRHSRGGFACMTRARVQYE